MKTLIYFIATLFLISFLFMNSTKANAQLFTPDPTIVKDLKKINTRLLALEQETMRSMRLQLEDIQRQIEEIKHALPQDSIGDVIDQINAQNKRLDDTNSIFKSDLIPTIHKEITLNQDKVDLATEKLSRLIAILKAIVDEQEEIKKSIKDLRQKANVNINQSEGIKKLLKQLKKDN